MKVKQVKEWLKQFDDDTLVMGEYPDLGVGGWSTTSLIALTKGEAGKRTVAIVVVGDE